MRKSFKDSPALRFLVQVDDNTTENETKPYSIDASENEPSDIQKKRRRHVKHEFTFEEEMARADYSGRQARIAGTVILDPRLSYSDFKLFAVLCLYQNYKTGVCWPSYSEINRRFGFPISSIKASINRLIEYDMSLAVKKTAFALITRSILSISQKKKKITKSNKCLKNFTESLCE